MDGINDDLGKPYVNVHNDNEHIDSYYSRSLGNAPPYLEFNEEVKKKYRSCDNRGCVERSYRHTFAEKQTATLKFI
ncbi:MAG: hypothetical protein KJP23_12955 [Deltaproteobacteria bacterium]|nr:hypothetical protein [Deltaproteobacteria bacterium]